MEVVLSGDQNDLIRKIAGREGFVYFELEATSGSSKGDNSLGTLTIVSIKEKTETMELMLKSAERSKELRKKFPIRNAFLREMYMYETIFPAFEELQRDEDSLEGFSGYAKSYGSLKIKFNESLVLENLKVIGYEMWDRKIPMNGDHIEVVFREYAKLHAMSFAMRERKPKLLKKLTKNLSCVFEYSNSKGNVANRELIKSILKNGLKAVKGNQSATDALKRLSLVMEKFLFEDIRKQEDQLAILHVDCWCNNLLFKYEDAENKTLSNVRIIDWQLSMIGSPAIDLTHFFFSAAPKEILFGYKKYLQIYHNTLCHTLLSLHCNPEKLFPFSLLEYHWQKYTKFGIYQSLIMVKLMLSESHEALDLTEIAENGKNFTEEIGFVSVNDDRYKQRILDIVNVSIIHKWL